jgi:hypothetical protein
VDVERIPNKCISCRLGSFPYSAVLGAPNMIATAIKSGGIEAGEGDRNGGQKEEYNVDFKWEQLTCVSFTPLNLATRPCEEYDL